MSRGFGDILILIIKAKSGVLHANGKCYCMQKNYINLIRSSAKFNITKEYTMCILEFILRYALSWENYELVSEI